MIHDDDFFGSIAARMVQEIRQRAGAPEAVAIEITATVLRAVSQQYAAQEIYVRRLGRYDPAAILADFHGNNHDDVCRRHGISRRTLYRIIDRQRSASRREQASVSTAA